MMIADQIIGRVGARILKDRLSDLAAAGGAESAARIILDRLAPGQVVAVVRAVKGDPDLAQWVDCKIPQHLVDGFEMPLGTTIEGNTATARNLDTDRLVLLTASGGEATTRDTAAHVTGLAEHCHLQMASARDHRTLRELRLPLAVASGFHAV
jgi:hypothetical protein